MSFLFRCLHLSAMLTTMLLVCMCVLVPYAVSVDRSKFRTCGDTGFCRRYRGKAPANYQVIFYYCTHQSMLTFSFNNQYEVDIDSVNAVPNHFEAKLRGTDNHDSKKLNLQVSFYTSGTARVKITEDSPRWQVWNRPFWVKYIKTSTLHSRFNYFTILNILMDFYCLAHFSFKPLDLLTSEGLEPASYSVLKGDDASLPSAVKASSSKFFALGFGSDREVLLFLA